MSQLWCVWNGASEPARGPQGAALKKGETVSQQLDSSMMVLKWMDKRPVVMLSTIHDNSFVSKKWRSRSALNGQEDIMKPLVVEEYNKNMGGVDTGQCHNITNTMYVYYTRGRVTKHPNLFSHCHVYM